MPGPRYGTPNATWFASVLERDEPGGAMYALNFMHYREQADYADGREVTRTGQEADDEYAPIGPLAAVGASIVFVAPVVHQLVGDDTVWDRIAIVRYPTRRAIIEMNLRDDFQQQHVHKEAGMASTIVVASFPEELDATAGPPGDRMLIQLLADADAPDLIDDVERTRLGRFSIEAVMIGDDRRFTEVRYDRVSAAVADELAARSPVTDASSYAVLVEPRIDQLADAAADI